jgi:hypothetical protein
MWLMRPPTTPACRGGFCSLCGGGDCLVNGMPMKAVAVRMGMIAQFSLIAWVITAAWINDPRSARVPGLSA